MIDKKQLQWDIDELNRALEKIEHQIQESQRILREMQRRINLENSNES